MPIESGTHEVRVPPPQKVLRSFRKKCSRLVSKLSLRGKRQSSAYEMLQQDCDKQLQSTEDLELQQRFFNAASSGDTKYMKQVVGSNGLLNSLWTGPGQFNVNIQNSNNTTALMCAARFGHLDAVRYLLFKKADPNIANSSGRTALHYAAVENKLKSNERIVNPLIKALLDVGADVTALDANDMTPLEQSFISFNDSAAYTLGAKTDADMIAVMVGIQAKEEKRARIVRKSVREAFEEAVREAMEDEEFEEDWSSDEDEDTDVGSTESYNTNSDFEPCEYAAGSPGSKFSGHGLRASAIVNGPSQVLQPETESSSQGSDYRS